MLYIPGLRRALTPGAKHYLQECCLKASMKPLKLVMYGNTHWGSWLLLIKRFINLRPVCTSSNIPFQFRLMQSLAISHFLEHADHKDSIPKAKGRTPKYSAWTFSDDDWKAMGLIVDALKVCFLFFFYCFHH